MQVVNLSLLTRDEFLDLIRSIEHLHFGGINCLLPHLDQSQHVVWLGLTSQGWLQGYLKFWLQKLLFGVEL
jgi:hypothetical protein